MNRAATPDPPGPGTLASFATSTRFRRDPLGETFAAFERYGDVICSRVGPWRFYAVFRPDHVRHILVDNHRNYVKGDLIQRAKILIGDGLFCTEGETWRRQRRIIQPTFDRRRVSALAPLITDATAAMLEEWTQHAEHGTRIDLARAMTGLTLDIIGKAFFGVDLRHERTEVGAALSTALAYINRRTTSIFPMLTDLPFPQTLRFRRALRILDATVLRIMRQRRTEAGGGSDLLSLLLAARDPDTGARLTDVELRDQIMTFVLAGHETTSLLLTWALSLLARHPAVEVRLRTETRDELGERPPSIDDLPRLPYTRMVLDETLRLYPPVWAFPREAVRDDSIGGYRLRSGSTVAILPYVMHRHPALWDDPKRFDPERFAADAEPPRAYLPFGGGPRQCIGSEFALMEAQLVLSMIARSYRVVIARTGPIEPEINVTLRPRGGVTATIHYLGTAAGGAGAGFP